MTLPWPLPGTATVVMLVQGLLAMLASGMGTGVSSRVEMLLFTPAASAGMDNTDKHHSAWAVMALIGLNEDADRQMGCNVIAVIGMGYQLGRRYNSIPTQTPCYTAGPQPTNLPRGHPPMGVPPFRNTENIYAIQQGNSNKKWPLALTGRVQTALISGANIGCGVLGLQRMTEWLFGFFVPAVTRRAQGTNYNG